MRLRPDLPACMLRAGGPLPGPLPGPVPGPLLLQAGSLHSELPADLLRSRSGPVRSDRMRSRLCSRLCGSLRTGLCPDLCSSLCAGLPAGQSVLREEALRSVRPSPQRRRTVQLLRQRRLLPAALCTDVRGPGLCAGLPAGESVL